MTFLLYAELSAYILTVALDVIHRTKRVVGDFSTGFQDRLEPTISWPIRYVSYILIFLVDSMLQQVI